MTGLRPSKCVLFDLDGTLYQSAEYSRYVDDQIAKLVSEMLQLRVEETRRLIRDRKAKFGTLTRTLGSLGINRDEFFVEIARRIDVRAYLQADPGLGRLILELKVRGFKIGLVSNSGRDLVNKILDAIGLPHDLFDVVVTSSDAAPKPSQEPFILALQRVGSDVRDSLYVGDRDEQELRPAKELGMTTVLVTETIDQDVKWADHVIPSLAGLLAILEKFDSDRIYRHT